MKLSLFRAMAALSVAGVVLPARGALPPLGTSIQQAATITLGMLYASTGTPPPRPAYTVQRGTALTFVINAPGFPNPTVTWYKDGKVIASGPTLEIPAASPADTGAYRATAVSAANLLLFSSDIARVLVDDGGQRLLNFSTRAHVDASQPTVLGGFVVAAGPAQTMVLVRAVGPTLSSFGVTDALADPQLTVTDSAGHVAAPLFSGPIEGAIVYPTPDQAAARVGAFPLPAGSKDVAHVYLLSGGAYTAQVSAASGSSGTVLLEVYEVPLRASISSPVRN